MGNARIVHTSPSITPAQARDARARALRFVLDCYAKRKGGPATAPDVRKESNGSGKTIVPK
jgi:hypothetical protein